MPYRKYSREDLEIAVQQSFSWGAVLDHFGKRRTGGNYNAFQRRIKKFEIDVTHFKGMGWSRGLTRESDERVRNQAKKISNVLNSLATNTHRGHVGGSTLKQFLIRGGVPYECSISICRISDWHGKPISLDVDHVNGDNEDQRLENLRFMCPNCHRQTGNWGSKNRRDLKSRLVPGTGLEPAHPCGRRHLKP